MEKKCKKCGKIFPKKNFVIYKTKKYRDLCKKCQYDKITLIQFQIYRRKNKLC
jgi:glyoxylate carboligase